MARFSIAMTKEEANICTVCGEDAGERGVDSDGVCNTCLGGVPAYNPRPEVADYAPQYPVCDCEDKPCCGHYS
jgi:hypothetical protein